MFQIQGELKNLNSQMQCVIDAGLDSHLDKPDGKNIIKNWEILTGQYTVKESFILIVMTWLAIRENSHFSKTHSFFSNKIKLQNRIPNKKIQLMQSQKERWHRGGRPRIEMTRDNEEFEREF